MLSYFTVAISWDQVNEDAISEAQLEVIHHNLILPQGKVTDNKDEY